MTRTVFPLATSILCSSPSAPAFPIDGPPQFSNTPASTVGLRFDDAWTSAEITIDDYVPSHIASDAEFSRDVR